MCCTTCGPAAALNMAATDPTSTIQPPTISRSLSLRSKENIREHPKLAGYAYVEVHSARRGAARRRPGRARSADLPNTVEGQIAEICRDLAAQAKRPHGGPAPAAVHLRAGSLVDPYLVRLACLSGARSARRDRRHRRLVRRPREPHHATRLSNRQRVLAHQASTICRLADGLITFGSAHP